MKHRTLEDIVELRADIKRRLFVGESVTGPEVAVCYPGYEGMAMASWLFGEAFAEHSMKVAAPWLDAPTKTLYNLYPRCPVTVYFRCQYLFKFTDLDGLKHAQKILEGSDSIVRQHDFLTNLYAQIVWNRGELDRSVRIPFQWYAKHRILDFFEHNDGNLWREPDFAEKQSEAIARGVPSILIVTLPKSGSLFLQNTLQQGLKAPHIGLSPLGLFADLIRSRVAQFARGGAVSVEHVLPDQDQRDILYAAGLRRFVFHFRDPRQAALSMVHHTLDSDAIAAPQASIQTIRDRIASIPGFFDKHYLNEFRRWAEFLDPWLAAIENDKRFDIFVSTFETMTADEVGTIQRVLKHFEVPDGVFDSAILDKPKEERAGHFRKGLQDEWKSVLGAEGLEKLDRAVDEFPHIAKVLRAREAVQAA